MITNMEIKKFEEIVLLNKREDVIRLHLYMKLLQKGIKPYESHLDILIDLYLNGGYRNAEEQLAFIKQCLDKEYMKSEQSVRNVLSKYTKNKVLVKAKNTRIELNEEYIPLVDFDKLVLLHKITHI